MKPWMKTALKWLIVLAVVAGLGMGIKRALDKRSATAQAVIDAAKAKPVSAVELAAGDVVSASLRELGQGLPLSGTLKAVNTAFVKAKVAGEIKGLTLREGDAVKAGQIIGTVDTTEFQARVNQAQRQATAAKAQVDIAQRQYNNNKALVDQGFISTTALDTSLATLEGAKASYEAAAAGVDVVRKSLDDTVLRAPISGIVSQRLTQPGERVAVDGRVIEIMDLSKLELEASLSPTDAIAVRIGQTATLTVEGSATPLEARISRINPNAQTGSRNVVAYLTVLQPAGLRQGLYAQGTLNTARVSLLAVPIDAVRTDKPAPYVQVIENDRIAHRSVTPSQRGTDDNTTWVAVEGIVSGAVVLRGGAGAVIEGTAVKFTGANVPMAAKP